jgi:predicted RNA-binding protein with PUA-like domain
MARRYWLFKSEPDVFSWDDLVQSEDRTTVWDGVRNFQARNLLRDEMKVGDGVLFYHSRMNPQEIAGIARIVRSGYPDPSQFDPKSKYHDPKATPDDPRWFSVDIRAEKAFRVRPTLPELKARDDLDGLMLLKRGARLSVQPVSPEHWKILSKLGRPQSID